MSGVVSPRLYSYANYREYLRDFYDRQKAGKTGFTYARFSQSVGIRSPNYFKLVMEGEKNLTATNAIRFAKGLGLEGAQADYFEALVNFNQAGNPLEREFFQERMRRLRQRAPTEDEDEKTVEEFEFESMSHWLHLTLTVMTNLRGFREDTAWLRGRLRNLAGESEIRKALDALERSGVLKRDAQGRLRQSHRQLRTRADLRRLAVRRFYASLFGRAAQALEIGTPEERELNAYVVGFDPKQLPEVRKRVREFMAGLNELALASVAPREVYSFMFAAVPVTGDA